MLEKVIAEINDWADEPLQNLFTVIEMAKSEGGADWLIDLAYECRKSLGKEKEN